MQHTRNDWAKNKFGSIYALRAPGGDVTPSDVCVENEEKIVARWVRKIFLDHRFGCVGVGLVDGENFSKEN